MRAPPDFPKGLQTTSMAAFPLTYSTDWRSKISTENLAIFKFSIPYPASKLSQND
jgi:hypothetical protein